VFAGPDLSFTTKNALMVPTPDGTGVVHMGGQRTLKRLYELKCSSTDCYWILMEKYLNVKRVNAVAIYVPDSFAICKN
jgi:hypothetical protein